MISRLRLDEQLGSLRAVLSRNDVLTEVLARTATLDLPGWYVTAGCLFQTVWNVVTDRPPTSGIKDYDVFYFDKGDLSWEAEDAVIKTGREVFADLPAEVEIRNEARVHLWYEDCWIDRKGSARTCRGQSAGTDQAISRPHGALRCGQSGSFALAIPFMIWNTLPP
jgi:hypothetical protein